ncbi:MAG: hypothetical protein V3U76_09750 [Granulosicoccus sp.]
MDRSKLSAFFQPTSIFVMLLCLSGGVTPLLANSDRPQSEMIDIKVHMIDLYTERLQELGVEWHDYVRPGSQKKGVITTNLVGDVGSFLSRIRALEAEGAANIKHNISASTLSNKQVLVGVGESVYVELEDSNNVKTLFSIEFGPTLHATPIFQKTHGISQFTLEYEYEWATSVSNDELPVVSRSLVSGETLLNAGDSLLLDTPVSVNAQDTGLPIHSKHLLLITPTLIDLDSP